MQVETLNIFCDVVRHQSFSRGAMANSVSQSAASQAVRQLERHLGAELIDRSQRPWKLTAEGKIFFKIRNLFGEEVAQGLDKEQLAEQYPKVYKALLES